MFYCSVKHSVPYQQYGANTDLNNGVADAARFLAEHLVLQGLVHDDVGHLLQVHSAGFWKETFPLVRH